MAPNSPGRSYRAPCDPSSSLLQANFCLSISSAHSKPGATQQCIAVVIVGQTDPPLHQAAIFFLY